jgi:hypothetical protein
VSCRVNPSGSRVAQHSKFGLRLGLIGFGLFTTRLVMCHVGSTRRVHGLTRLPFSFFLSFFFFLKCLNTKQTKPKTKSLTTYLSCAAHYFAPKPLPSSKSKLSNSNSSFYLTVSHQKPQALIVTALSCAVYLYLVPPTAPKPLPRPQL